MDGHNYEAFTTHQNTGLTSKTDESDTKTPASPAQKTVQERNLLIHRPIVQNKHEDILDEIISIDDLSNFLIDSENDSFSSHSNATLESHSDGTCSTQQNTKLTNRDESGTKIIGTNNKYFE